MGGKKNKRKKSKNMELLRVNGERDREEFVSYESFGFILRTYKNMHATWWTYLKCDKVLWYG